MTQEQWMAVIRMVLQMGGVIVVTHGWFTNDDWVSFSTNLVTFIGAGAALWGVGWTLWSRRAAGLKASVANMQNTVVVTTNGDRPGGQAAVANSIAGVPGVVEVKAGADVAIQAPSPRVVP